MMTEILTILFMTFLMPVLKKSFRSRVLLCLQDIYRNFVVKPIYLSTVKMYFCTAIAV